MDTGASHHLDSIAIARRVGAFALGVVVLYFARFAFSKFKEFNAKSLAAVLGCLLMGTAVTQLVSHLFTDEIALAVYPVGLLIGLLVYPLIAPPAEPIANGAPDDTSKGTLSKLWALLGISQQSKCRIFIYGLTRSGKTMLIQQILGAMPPRIPESTKEFLLYKGSLKLDFADETRLDLILSDYRGQRVSQVLQDPPKTFFGSPGARLINIIIFLIDCVPELTDNEGRVLNDDEIVERYSKGAKKKITDRIAQHTDYISSPVVELVFRAAFSTKHLFAVRLLMNKVDLLERFAAEGYLDGVSSHEVEAYVKQLIKPIAARVESVCASNNITDYADGLLSAKKGANVKEIIGPLLATFSHRSSLRK